MIDVTMEDAARFTRVESGSFDQTKITLFSTMKNEMAFLPAWLDHHRSMGFQQFLIWDDASDDGTFETLCDQPDCVVLRSDLTYGEELRYTDPDGVVSVKRAGIWFKIAIPHVFVDGAYVGYLDADEFIILPPGVSSIAKVVERLRNTGAPSAVASVVEFFPATVDDLNGAMPKTATELFSAYPWFEAEQLVRLRPGNHPEMTGMSKTARLFARYEVHPKVTRHGWQWLWMPAREKKAQQFQKSPRHKTPLLRRDANTRLIGSHNGNLHPSSDILLTVAHFVFTSQFAKKIENATKWNAHANGAAKYHYYATLLERMRGVPDAFIGERSVHYDGPSQMIDAGLMRWDQK